MQHYVFSSFCLTVWPGPTPNHQRRLKTAGASFRPQDCFGVAKLPAEPTTMLEVRLERQLIRWKQQQQFMVLISNSWGAVQGCNFCPCLHLPLLTKPSEENSLNWFNRDKRERALTFDVMNDHFLTPWECHSDEEQRLFVDEVFVQFQLVLGWPCPYHCHQLNQETTIHF